MERIAFGPFEYDPGSQSLLRDSIPVPIGYRAGLLLEALLKRPGETITKAELLDAAWPGLAVEDNNLSVQLTALRKVLAKRTDGSEWIIAVPRVGYRFAPIGSRAVVAEEPIPSLAVLPFANLGGDPGQDYFADGIVDDLIAALARFKSFRVVARNSSFVFKGRSVDIRDAARKLGVRYILEGSVRSAGGKLRVTAQLIDGQSGTQLWSRTFNGTLDDVFDVQDRITESVATVIEPKIQLAEIERARRDVRRASTPTTSICAPCKNSTPGKTPSTTRRPSISSARHWRSIRVTRPRWG